MTVNSMTPPSSPLLKQKDWDIEKSLLLHQIAEYKSYIDELEKKHQDEKLKYQTNQHSLLREIENKDKYMKKCITEIENNYQNKINQLLSTFEDEKLEFKKREQEIIEHYSHTMLFEQQKYEGRIALMGTPPVSPVTPRFNMQDEQSRDHFLHNDKLREQNRRMKGNQQLEEEVEDEKTNDKDTILTVNQEQEQEQQQQQKIKELENRLNKMSKDHLDKIKQMTKQFDESQARLKDLYINENQQIMMHCEARLENLVMEQNSNLKELEDAFTNEKEILFIHHQQLLEDAIQKEKLEFSQRWAEAEEELNDVLKDQEKKIMETERASEEIQNKYTNLKKGINSKLTELKDLKREIQNSSRIAKNILSITNSTSAYDLTLSDMLNKISSQVVTLQTKANVAEKNNDSYSMGSMPFYAF